MKLICRLVLGLTLTLSAHATASVVTAQDDVKANVSQLERPQVDDSATDTFSAVKPGCWGKRRIMQALPKRWRAFEQPCREKPRRSGQAPLTLGPAEPQPEDATNDDDQVQAEPAYLKDRGTGVATSMFGTYVRRGEVIVYPFFEYYRDRNFEYKPEEFGFAGNQDFRGRYRATEELLFLGYGLTDNLALELEVATIQASLEKSPLDFSTMPRRIEESGLGDVAAQLRWRWRKENERRPEFFSYAEVVFPHHKKKRLIGTPGWELNVGTGLTKGFTWGTMTFRAALEYSGASTSHFDLGEVAVEYLKRLSPKWRLYVGLEGNQDELSLITEAQWHLSRRVYIKFNNGLGLTSKATDWSPEIGIVFTIPTSRAH
ncbi:MAG: hypothetical protein ACREBG_27255 [Pyrinomonadaceae bacterium]